MASDRQRKILIYDSYRDNTIYNMMQQMTSADMVDVINVYLMTEACRDLYLNACDCILISSDETFDMEEDQLVLLLKMLKDTGIVIFNSDNEHLMRLAQHFSGKTTLTYGLNSRSTIIASFCDDILNEIVEICIQRYIKTDNGVKIEPVEFCVNNTTHDINKLLAGISGGICSGISWENIQSYFR